MFSTGRRDATEVVFEILTLAQAGVSRNQIVHQVNLNFQMANRYVSQLTGKNLIQKRNGDNSAERYELTARGEKVFRLLSEVENELVRPNRRSRTPSVSVPTKLLRNGGPKDSTVNPMGQVTYERTNWVSLLGHLLPYLAGFLVGLGLGYLIP